MRLYTSPLSPFGARVRGSLLCKNITVKMIKPSEVAEGFATITPIGKIPVLALDDGTMIVESDTIVEYLEDRYPEPSLRPRNLERRAQSRMLSRIVELYVMGAVSILSPMMPLARNKAPAPRDEKLVETGMAQLRKALGNLEHFLSREGPHAVGDELSSADVTIASFTPFVYAVEKYLDQAGLIAERPTLSGIIGRFPTSPLLQEVCAGVTKAMEDRRLEIVAMFGSR